MGFVLPQSAGQEPLEEAHEPLQLENDEAEPHDCCSTCDNGIAGNSGGNEDTIAYCNDACIQSLGALDYMRPGFHDWGNSVAQDTLALPACMFLGNNPPLADSVPRTRCQ
jgi:hypothetical protein